MFFVCLAVAESTFCLQGTLIQSLALPGSPSITRRGLYLPRVIKPFSFLTHCFYKVEFVNYFQKKCIMMLALFHYFLVLGGNGSAE